MVLGEGLVGKKMKTVSIKEGLDEKRDGERSWVCPDRHGNGLTRRAAITIHVVWNKNKSEDFGSQ